MTAVALLAATAVAEAETVVSIQFDDGYADQYQTRAMLAARGMRATYYINSGLVGTNGNMTWAQIQGLAADGNEIGGHSLTHEHLPRLTYEQQLADICADRTALQGRGFEVTSFAYPYGEHSLDTIVAVQQCGYATARTTAGIGIGTSPYAETLPPRNQFATRTQGSATNATTLADLQSAVTQAEQNGGGWVHLVFHQVCTGCSIYGVPPSTIEALLDWLQPRFASGTVVKTVREAMDGTPVPPPPPPPPDTTRPSVSLTNPANGATVSGSIALRATASDNRGVARVEFRVGTTLIASDASAPYAATWNTSTRPDGAVTVTARAVDAAGNNASSSATVTIDNVPPDDPPPPPGPPPTQPTQPTTGPSGPPGPGAPSPSVAGSLDTTAPLTTITCNRGTCARAFRGPVTVALAATDELSGVGAVRYTTDGSQPTLTNGSSYLGPFRVWDAATVRFAAWDAAGNAEAPQSAAIALRLPNLLPNGGFEAAAGRRGLPGCWTAEGTGRTRGSVRTTREARSGRAGSVLTVRSRASGDRRLYVTRDAGRCAVGAAAGRAFRLRVWYRGTGPRLFVWYRAADGGWKQLATSRRLPSTKRWTLAEWETPALPDGADQVSPGVSLATIGTVTVDDLALQ